MGLLSRGMAWLSDTLGTAAGESVTYTRGSDSVSLTAWVGRTLFATQSVGSTARVEWGERDYLIPVADLVLATVAVTPRKGDRISQVIDGDTLVFEIVAPGNEPSWRYSDPGRTLYRVHCKRVA